jgi:glutaredoxin-dependent peroxiredoxin
MPLAPGTTAPNFALQTKSAEGVETVRLSDHRGKDVVVLLFFPAVNTPVCTQEMCDVSAGIHPLFDAVVYGISVDLPWAQEMWAKANEITTPLLSDHKGEVTRAYDAVWPNFDGVGAVSARASFVINPQGIIVYSEQTPALGDMPNFAQIQLAVESALATA